MFKLLKKKKVQATVFIRDGKFFAFPESPELELFLTDSPDPYGFTITQGEVTGQVLEPRLKEYASTKGWKVANE